jgi:outer membrane protein assembly factor BamB
MAASGNLVYVPFVNLCFDATATGIKSANFNGGTGGLAAIDSATGKIVWQHNLPSPAYGAATVANDVVFTATLAGKIYAYDTKTGKALWTTTGPAGINSFPAVTKSMLIIGAGATSKIKNPKNEIVAYSLNASGAAKTQSTPKAPPAPPSTGSGAKATPAAPSKGTTVQVKGGEFFFRLSAKSAKAGPVTFLFQNIGHVEHDFSIDGKTTPLIQPGQTAKLAVTLKKGSYPYLCTVPGHAEAGMKGTFTVG